MSEHDLGNHNSAEGAMPLYAYLSLETVHQPREPTAAPYQFSVFSWAKAIIEITRCVRSSRD
jgi:hypothetical protein